LADEESGSDTGENSMTTFNGSDDAKILGVVMEKTEFTGEEGG
jgi:hypothetical protein